MRNSRQNEALGSLGKLIGVGGKRIGLRGSGRGFHGWIFDVAFETGAFGDVPVKIDGAADESEDEDGEE